ncbi:dynein heavy chain, N-terminal region 1-domain-containing protein [Ochromonadaceae sp. CCMP2298]|nr:dynein heavy chain, N-terminal region 1-domain-containing protein [Ochromonadaceae sp. CCMP2298]
MEEQEHEVEVEGEEEESSLQYDFLLTWMGQRLNLLDHPEDTWQGGHTVIVEFVSGLGPKTMSVLKTDSGVRFSADTLSHDVREDGLLAFFIRNSSVRLSKENVNKEIQFGSIGGRGLSLVAFERLMKGLVEKQVAQNNELTGHFHRCMATLTDAVHFSDGRTVLYCPTFEFNSVSEASQDKERLQIMESIVIHWTRQIKDVVNNHDSSASAETSGPLDEIEFWKGRAQDLIGIQKQLEGERVCRLIEVLQYAKSNYIGPFQTLTKQIVERAAESNDNLKFLESIRSQCTALRQIEPESIVNILPDLLNRIRLIWSLSSFYNDNEHVSGILRKISNEVIRRFRGHVDMSKILNGDVEFSIMRLKEGKSGFNILV